MCSVTKEVVCALMYIPVETKLLTNIFPFQIALGLYNYYSLVIIKIN